MSESCAVDGCAKSMKYGKRGWCQMHYRRWQLTGDPHVTIGTRHGLTNEQRLLARLAEVRTDDECWEWMGDRSPGGYGRLKAVGRKGMRANRLAYITWVGEIPEGMLVCHRCDNPPCVNPKHLFLGTSNDNMQDKVAKGRQLVGEAVTNHVLTEDQVIQIKKLYRAGICNQSELARMFGCSFSNVHLIVHGKRWAHVDVA